MRLLILSWLSMLVGLQFVSLVASQQDLPLWSQQVLSPKELLMRPYFLDLPSSSSSVESSDYDSSSSGGQKIAYPSSSSHQSSSSGALKKRVAAMGVDLPDYILHYRGKSPDLGSFRERMQLSGRR